MKTSTKIIIGVAAAAVLAFAFWYGGSAPGMHGWTSGSAEETQADSVSEGEEVAEPAGITDRMKAPKRL